MLTTFEWISLISILLTTLAGGYYPLFHKEQARRKQGLPHAEAFSAGVFLALALTLMLPSSLHLLSAAYPHFDFPLGVVFALLAFLALLGTEHRIERIRQTTPGPDPERCTPAVPLTMTVMIAIPSFFLGTALGISSTEAAILIFIAIMLHKSSAAFGLALSMVRSNLTTAQVWAAFLLFACSTPAGIVVGEEIHAVFQPHTIMIIKGVVLGLAAGTFLYMATLHELQNGTLVTKCANPSCFLAMLAGLILTIAVRVLMGEAHALAG